MSSGDSGVESNFCIASLDVGTTNVKCLIVNSRGFTIGQAHERVKLYQPQPGWMEIIPDELYSSILEVVHKAVQDANISFDMVKSFGISTHRATFITWKKDSGEYLHNFITWQDKRAEQLVKEVNSSWLFFCFRWLCSLIYSVSKSGKFKVSSNFNMSCLHVSSRLLWVLSNFDNVRECLKNNNLMFGTLDTWLLYKLTKGRIYVTDVSSASATGLFDIFNLSWGFLPFLLKIPYNILPKIVDNDYSFGTTSCEIFGQPLNIGCSMGDQMASMFGSGCYNNNDLKITIGTGAFLDVNTGDTVHPSLNNMYPIIGWKINNKLNYILEIPCTESGSAILWLLENGLISEPSESSLLASKVENSNGIYFLPNKSSQLPDKTDAVFRGLNSSSTQEHKVRAVLESIVYKIVLAYLLLLTERNREHSIISIDGGIAKNDFICQLLADLSGLPVRRMVSTEMSGMGVAYAAGLTSQLWKNIEVIQSLQVIQRIFHPTPNEKYKREMLLNLKMWQKFTNE